MPHPRRLIIALMLVGLLLLSVQAAAARACDDCDPPSGTHPIRAGAANRLGRISWTPFRIVQSVAAGQTLQLTASFVSSSALHDLRLVIPGQLGQHVIVAPAHFDIVAANTPTSVTFTISMPMQHAHTLAGVVLVRMGQRVVSQPLPVRLVVAGRGENRDVVPGHPAHPPHGRGRD